MSKISKVIITICFFINCGCFLNANISEVSDGSNKEASHQSISILSSKNIIIVNSEADLIVEGGNPPFEFTLLSGDGSIDSINNKFIASGTPGTSVVQVKDASNKTATVVIIVNKVLEFSRANLVWAQSPGYVFDFSKLLMGGVPPYFFSKVSGQGSIDSQSGNYTQVYGWGSTILKAQDSDNNSATLTIANRPTLFNDSVTSFAEANGYLYVGGRFTAVNSFDTPHFAALNKTSGDLTDIPCNWTKKIKGTVLAILPDNENLYIGGDITDFDGVTVQGLIKLNRQTCILDTIFTQELGFNGSVLALGVLGDSLYVGGRMVTYRGMVIGSIAKINKVTGDLDTTFSQAIGFSGGGSEVDALVTYGSAIYVAGWFTTYRGSVAQNLAKIDAQTGNLDTTFTQAIGLNSSATSMILAKNSIYVSGQFNGYRGFSARNVAKIDLTSGDLDASFNQTTGFNGTVFKIVASADSLYALGQFSSYRSVAAQRLAKIDLINGDLDSTFTQPTGFTSLMSAMAISDNSLYIGGSISSYRGQEVNGLIKVDLLSGNLDTVFSKTTGFSNLVLTLETAGDSVYVGGYFTSYRGLLAHGLARINLETGAVDESFLANAVVGSCNDIAIDNGSLYVAGGPGGVTKLDLVSGVIDSTFTQSPGFSFSTKSLAIANNSLYVGGTMTTYNGAPTASLAKINLTTGILDTTFTQTTGFNQWVEKIITDGSALYVAGYFSSYRGTAVQRLAKLDLNSGNLDTTFSAISGFNNTVKSLLIIGNDIYAGGDFWTYRSISVGGLAKLNKLTGVMDTGFSQSTGFQAGFSPLTMIYANSSIYIGGIFYRYNSIMRPRLVKIDPTTGALDNVFSNEIGYDGSVLSLFSDGSMLYVGGQFKSYNNQTTNSFVRTNLNSGLPF